MSIQIPWTNPIRTYKNPPILKETYAPPLLPWRPQAPAGCSWGRRRRRPESVSPPRRTRGRPEFPPASAAIFLRKKWDTHIYIYIYVYIYIHMYIYIYVFIFVYLFIHVFFYLYIHSRHTHPGRACRPEVCHVADSLWFRVGQRLFRVNPWFRLGLVRVLTQFKK